MTEKKPLKLRLEDLPPKIRDMVQIFHPGATGIAVEETHSGHDVEQVGEQTKQQGFLITCYVPRQENAILFRVVDTNDNWSMHWYKMLHVLRAQYAS